MAKRLPAAAPPPPKALDQMVERAHVLSQARSRINEMVLALKRGIDALRRDAMPEIRVAIDEASEAWKALHGDIRAHPELFVRPRTVEAHGIRFGLAASKDSLDIPDPDKTVRLIREHLPDMADGLIQTKETPVKDALSRLKPAELKRIGVKVEGGGDVVVIRPADRDLDNLVKALVSAAASEPEGSS